MDLKNFPMDVQTCIMQLESCEYTINTHMLYMFECLIWDHFGGHVSQPLSILQIYPTHLNLILTSFWPHSDLASQPVL